MNSPYPGRYDFDSVQEFASACKEIGCNRDQKNWSGESTPESLKFCETGDISRVEKAELILETLQCDTQIDRIEWRNGIGGVFPNIPEFLANSPECMRQRVHVQTERTPLDVYVDLTSAAGIGHEDLLKRGIAILAMILQTQKVRQVNLTAYCALDGGKIDNGIVTVKLSTPFILSEIAYVLSSAGFARNLCYDYLQKKQGSYGRWPGTKHPYTLLQVPESNLCIPPVFLSDLIIKEPTRWVRENLQKYASRLED